MSVTKCIIYGEHEVTVLFHAKL